MEEYKRLQAPGEGNKKSEKALSQAAFSKNQEISFLARQAM